MEKKLGKIESVKFGIGGYQDCQLGLHVTLGDGSWGVGDSRSEWDPERIECSEYSQWTEEDRDKKMAEVMRYLSSLLKDAKVNTVDQLKGCVRTRGCGYRIRSYQRERKEQTRKSKPKIL